LTGIPIWHNFLKSKLILFFFFVAVASDRPSDILLCKYIFCGKLLACGDETFETYIITTYTNELLVVPVTKETTADNDICSRSETFHITDLQQD